MHDLEAEVLPLPQEVPDHGLLQPGGRLEEVHDVLGLVRQLLGADEELQAPLGLLVEQRDSLLQSHTTVPVHYQNQDTSTKAE